MAKVDRVRTEITGILVKKPSFLIRWGLTVLAALALAGYCGVRIFYGRAGLP